MWRERLYRRHKTTGSDANWKRVRALNKQVIRQCKQVEMQNYLSSMKHNVTMSQIYGKLRQIRGRPPRQQPILKVSGNEVTNPLKIANCLATTFAATTSYRDQADDCEQHRKPKNSIICSAALEPFNYKFSLHQLKSASLTGGCQLN